MLSGYFGDDDIPFLLGADFGVAVVIGSTTLPGIKDESGKDALTSNGVNGVSATEITVSVQTSALKAISPTVKNRATITVDGASYRIRDMNKNGDGAITHILLEGPL